MLATKRVGKSRLDYEEGGENYGPPFRSSYRAPNVIPLDLRVYSNPPCRSSTPTKENPYGNGVYRYEHSLDKDGACIFCNYESNFGSYDPRNA